jgi:hypothetical protein
MNGFEEGRTVFRAMEPTQEMMPAGMQIANAPVFGVHESTGLVFKDGDSEEGIIVKKIQRFDVPSDVSVDGPESLLRWAHENGIKYIFRINEENFNEGESSRYVVRGAK